MTALLLAAAMLAPSFSQAVDELAKPPVFDVDAAIMASLPGTPAEQVAEHVVLIGHDLKVTESNVVVIGDAENYLTVSMDTGVIRLVGTKDGVIRAFADTVHNLREAK